MKKKIPFKIILCFSFWILISSTVSSQVTKDIPNYFPVSPNAASFAKQGLFPVDYSTGKINIGIPLYTIKTNGITVPIDVSYNSAGIQLDELASWVGLGWNLNAGGAVIRNVKGIPDNSNPVPNIANLAFTDANYRILYNQFDPYNFGTIDTAYDEFIVNAPGLSGTFYFVDNKAVFRDLQNTVVKTSLNNNQLLTNTPTLEITKDDGTVYRFGQGLDDYNATEITNNTDTTYKPDYVSTWYLTEIIPANSKSPKDIISFKYKPVTYTSDYQIIIGETLVDNNISNNNPPKLKSIYPGRTSSNRQFLTAINFNNGTIEFTSSQNRQDLADDYKLDKISVYNVLGISKKLIQDYSFVYDYYNRSGGSTTSSTASNPGNPNDYYASRNANSRNKSLKLTQIKNEVLNVKHTFEYETTQLPQRGTTQKDYWGYINTNTGNLSPQTLLNRKSEMAPQNVTLSVGNGNRSSNENKMKSGVLQKITYPEGGYSIFEYEANRYTESVTIPTITNQNAYATAFGYNSPNCTVHYATSTFTPVNYVSGSGKITISFMEATDENGGTTNVTYDSETFQRPLPFTKGGTFFYTRDFGNSTHTLSAQEFRTGNFGPYRCPITSITASWQEVSQTTTAPTVKLIGGLRIMSIKNYDGVNSTPISTRQYSYEKENVLVREGNGSYVRGVFAEDRKSDVLPIFSTTAVFDNNTGGSPAITYGKITETDIANDGKKNGKTEYFYENIPLSRIFDIKAGNLPTVFKSPSFNINLSYNIYQPMEYLTNFAFFNNELWNHGSLLEKKTYKTGDLPNTFKIINSVVNTYSILKQSTLPYNIIFNNYPYQVNPGDDLSSFYLPYKQQGDFHTGQFYYAVGQTSLGKKVMTTTTETDYDNNEKETNKKTTTYGYENPLHYQVTKTETTNSKNDALRTQLSYPQDLLTTGQTVEMQKLVTQNKIDKPIKTETFVNNIQTSESITKFEESSATGNLLLPKEIHSTKGTVDTFPFNDANRKINFNLYDTDIVNGVTVGNGNVLQYAIENGTPVCIIWGYNKSQPIAKIENITYANIPTGLITAAQDASNTGTESALLDALDNLRIALPATMVTTYTYIPLVGVSTITDPKGYKMIYTYDTANRLQFVKDAQGNLLSENQYRYKNQ